MQYKANNFRGALQEYFQKQGSEIKLNFYSEPKDDVGLKVPVFVCTCTAGDLAATGEGSSKKQAIQRSALAVIKKIANSSMENFTNEANLEPKKLNSQPSSKKRGIKAVIVNKQYLNGNFRGALQEVLTVRYPGVTLNFKTEL